MQIWFLLAAVTFSQEPGDPMFAEPPGPAPAPEEERLVGFEIGADVVSKYIFRGLTVNDQPTLQPWATLSAGNDTLGTFSAGIWGNMDLGDEFDNQGEFTELDYIGSYSRSFGNLGTEVGYIYYDFPNTDLDATQEVYGSLSVDGLPVTPSLTAYYDFDLADGWYLNAALDHSIDLGDGLTLDLGLSAGWMDEDQAAFYYGVDDDGFSDIIASASLGYAINDNMSASLGVQAIAIPDSDFRDAVDDPDNIIGVAGFAFAF